MAHKLTTYNLYIVYYGKVSKTISAKYSPQLLEVGI